MKRILAILAIVPILLIGGRWLVHAFASDETHIRWTLEDMVEGFNAGRARGSVSGLAKDWRHEGSSVDRELLRGGLLGRFQRDRSSSDRRLTTRATLDWDAMTLEVNENARAALTVTEIRFERMAGELWELAWHIRVEAEWTDGEDGWRIVRSRHDDLEGSRLR